MVPGTRKRKEKTCQSADSRGVLLFGEGTTYRIEARLFL